MYNRRIIVALLAETGSVQTGSGTHLPSDSNGAKCSFAGSGGWGMKSHMPRLKMNGTIPVLTICLHEVHRDTLTFPFALVLTKCVFFVRIRTVSINLLL
jgi:hypothetical protein